MQHRPANAISRCILSSLSSSEERRWSPPALQSLCLSHIVVHRFPQPASIFGRSGKIICHPELKHHPHSWFPISSEAQQ